MLTRLVVLCYVFLSLVQTYNVQSWNIGRRWFSSSIISSSIILNQCVMPVNAKSELPTLEKCFAAVRNEVNDGQSIKRLQEDINSNNWDDIIQFSREYDAGFRGGVLKSIWKQLDVGKEKGIELANSFTYDLIGLNKAARRHDVDDANFRLNQVREDLSAFLQLEMR